MNPRSAPDSWGPWPPSDGRIREVVERAARKLAETIKAQGGESRVLLVIPQTRGELDLQYTPDTRMVMVGRVWAIGEGEEWQLHWNPATDEGRTIRTTNWKA